MREPFNPLTLLDPETPATRVERLERVAAALCGPVPWNSAREMMLALLDHIERAASENRTVRVVVKKRDRRGGMA
jgi:hypothetical protein